MFNYKSLWFLWLGLIYVTCGANIEDVFDAMDLMRFRFDSPGFVNKGWAKELKNYPEISTKSSPGELAEYFDLMINTITAGAVLYGKVFACRDWKIIPDKFKTINKYVFKLWPNNNKSSLITSKIALADALSCLQMCSCKEEACGENRLLLVFYILNDVAKKYPDINTKLVYTSFASGGLLQDFMIILGLIHLGYNNLELNFIDHEYVTGGVEFEKRKAAFPKLIDFYVQNFKKVKNPDYNLNLNYSPFYYKNIYEYIEAVGPGKKDKSNVLIAVDWGQAPDYPLGNMLNKDAVDFNGVDFLNLKEIGSGSIEFMMKIPVKGPLNLIWKVKDKNIDYLLPFLNKAQNEVAEFIGTDQFRKKFIEYLISKPDFVSKFKEISFSVSIPAEWELLIDKAAIEDKDKRVIYQLTRNVITPGFLDDMDHLEQYNYEKYFLPDSLPADDLNQKLSNLKENLVELKEKLVLLQGKLQSLWGALAGV